MPALLAAGIRAVNKSVFFFNPHPGTSLVIHWLRLHAPNAGGMDSIPDQGSKIPHDVGHSQKKTKKQKNPQLLKIIFKKAPSFQWGRTGNISG